MDPTLVTLWSNLLAANLGATLVGILLIFGYFFVLVFTTRKYHAQALASLAQIATSQARVETSAEHIAEMVHDLHQRRP